MVNKLRIELGTKFGKWEILSKNVTIKNNLSHWKCRCECGNEAEIPLNNLMNGSSTQCFECGTKQSGKKRRKGYKQISGDYWSQIKHKAKKKKMFFNIRIEEAWNKYIEQDKKCALLGSKIEFSGYPYERDKTTATLSLIDPSMGYVIENIQWVHKDIQKMKGKLTNEEFTNYVHWISGYQSYLQGITFEKKYFKNHEQNN